MPALGGSGILPPLGLAPVAVAAHRSSPWAWRAGGVSRRPAPGLSDGVSLWFVGVRCGCFLCVVFPVSGGFPWRGRGSSGRALVAGVGWVGVVVWRSALARSGVGAMVVVGFRSASAAAVFAAAWSGWCGFPLAVRRFAGPVFGVSVPVAVPPSLRLAAPVALPAPVAWARAA